MKDTNARLFLLHWLIRMLRLVDLSDEILAQVFGLSSLFIATLWSAGDLALNKRIARSCSCVQTDSRSPSAIRKWPSMLSSLYSLKKIIIEVEKIDSMFLDALRLQLMQLSPTLRHLELVFEDASQLPFRTASFPPDAKSGSNPDTWDLKSYFPSLTHASFVENGAMRGHSRGVVHTDSLNIFPSTLATLNWSVQLQPESSLMHLPRGLTWLDFGASYKPFAAPPNMDYPPNLTHLNGLTFTKAEDLRQLPRSLVSGKWLCTLPTTVVELSADLLQALPPNMERWTNNYSTRVLESTPAWTSLFPRNLTSLSLRSHPFGTEDIMLLPRTLTFFGDVIIRYDDVYATYQRLGLEEARQIWPPHLTHMTLNRGTYTSIKDDHYVVMPHSLTHLRNIHMESMKSFLNKCVASLPPNLVSVNAFALNVFFEYSVQVQAPLPARWTDLSLSGATFALSALKMFPRELTTLKLHSVDILKKDYSTFLTLLPPKLKTLVLEALYFGAISQLPLSITFLGLHKQLPKAPFDKNGRLPRGLLLVVDYKDSTEYTADGRTQEHTPNLLD